MKKPSPGKARGQKPHMPLMRTTCLISLPSHQLGPISKLLSDVAKEEGFQKSIRNHQKRPFTQFLNCPQMWLMRMTSRNGNLTGIIKRGLSGKVSRHMYWGPLGKKLADSSRMS